MTGLIKVMATYYAAICLIIRDIEQAMKIHAFG